MSSAYHKAQFYYPNKQSSPQNIGNRHAYYSEQGSVVATIGILIATVIGAVGLGLAIWMVVDVHALQKEVSALDLEVTTMINMTKDDLLELLGNTSDVGTRVDTIEANSANGPDPAASTDNAITLWDGTTGRLLKDSVVTIDGSGNIVTAGTVDGVDVSALDASVTSHVGDASIHFTEASIQHVNIVAGDGSDHTFIDQDVTTGGTPTFSSVTTSGFNGGTSEAVTGDTSPVSPSVLVTALSTAGVEGFTLADGAVGQVKIISMVATGGAGTLTPTNLAGGTTITFTNVGDSATLLFIGTSWAVIGVSGAVVA